MSWRNCCFVSMMFDSMSLIFCKSIVFVDMKVFFNSRISSKWLEGAGFLSSMRYVIQPLRIDIVLFRLATIDWKEVFWLLSMVLCCCWRFKRANLWSAWILFISFAWYASRRSVSWKLGFKSVWICWSDGGGEEILLMVFEKVFAFF